jgi:hypothetical protein
MKSFICLVISLVALQVASSSKWIRDRRGRGGNFVNLDNYAQSNANSLAINTGIFGDANAISNSDATNVNVINQRN